MYILDSIGNLESLSIYLSRPSGEPLGCLDEYINEQTASLVRGLNQQQELSFEITRQDNDWYEYIQEGMYLFLETVGIFKMKQPKITYDGVKEIKSVTAYSCDNELEDKNITFDINMGTKTSMEYLVEYSGVDENEELINPYTGIPYDWILLYNTLPEQLTKHLSDYDRRYFGTPDSETGDIVVTEREKIDVLNDLFTLTPRLKNRFAKTYDEETGSEDYTLIEYADITYNSYSGVIESITLYPGYRDRVVFLIDFYRRNHASLSLLDIVLSETHGSWTVGDIYGLADGDYTLANKKFQFEISENIYSFLATNLAQTTNCMVTFDIFNRKVNIAPVETIGENTGITISYDNLLNQLDIEPDEDNMATRLIVQGADGLSITQVNFGMEYIDDITYKLNAVDEGGKRIYVSDALATKYMQFINFREGKRERYIQLSKDYSNYASQISEVKNRVPVDDLKTDWGTFTSEELSGMLTIYKNLLAALISMYRSEYYPEGLNNDDSVNENFIKHTVYWYDYEAYKNIITEIECAISTYPYYSDHDKWSDYNKALYEDAIKAWETEWSLFGTIELQAKIDTYKANMDLLAESSVIRTAPDEDTIKAWNQLTPAEKTSFGNLEINYQYDAYMDNYDNMVSAKEYLDTLLEEVADLEEAQAAAQEERVDIVKSVLIENYFTEDECKIISMLYRDADCTNENILVTSINSTDERIDIMKELLEYGQEQLSIMSRPQLQFSINSDNLLSLVDYKEFWDDFKVGNYIMVQYRDDTFIKLRMIGYHYNPCLPSDGNLEITFSNFIRSKVGVTDLENLLGLSSTNSSGGGSGSGGSGSGGVYGESDDIDVTISNTMLAKLLNSETFGTRVKDVILNTIDVNAITARYATFNGLANGVTIIDGNCITTGVIRDLIYKGLVDDGVIENGSVSNTSGSVINLNTGNFNFAGGKIKYDGSLLTIASDVVIGGQETVAEVIADIVHAQETADGKTKVYYGTPAVVVPPTYDLNQGDYLVDSTDGSTYRWDVGTSAWIEATNYASAIEDAIEDLEEEIIIQIDAKIETWTQSTNPATQWDTDELRKKHNSDLWFYTGIDELTVDGVTIYPSKTYKYNYSTGKWDPYNSPTTSLFDFADGKTTIYYGTPTGTYTDVEVGDYLVDSTDGCTYRWNGTSWVKLTDYVSAIQDEAATIYSAIGALEDDLQEQIDAKIETYVQNTNPAADWDSGTLESHDGDLWYYSGISSITVDGVTILPSKTYQYDYDNDLWVLYNSPSRSLFDLADGKSTIFYGSTSGTYSNVETNDYLVDPTDGCTYKWNGSAWVKVTDYSSSITSAINALRDDLEEQIDAKIETWVQNSDPINDWDSSELEAHDGDLWYYNGLSNITSGTVTIYPSQTYQYDYSQGKWVAYKQPAKSLFDFADGKSTVYYGAPTGTYTDVEENDYLVNPADGCTYKYYNNAWVKVTDYKTDINSAISALRSDLEEQIDAKIETWAQSTNPASDWSSASLESHDGDLWFYTGTTSLTVDNVTILPSKTYQYDYDTGLWVLYNSPAVSLFDFADGKTTIFYGQPTGTYTNVAVGDYLVDDTDGATYKWSGTAWVKVTDYQSVVDSSINDLRDELEEQIDSKLETWAKSSNPALAWNVADYESHDGDLWLYTGMNEIVLDGLVIHPQGVYQFNYVEDMGTVLEEDESVITDEEDEALVGEHAYIWTEYSSNASNIFDFADGKSTIYYGSPEDTYSNLDSGDYLVDPDTGCTYKYDGSIWINVTDYEGSIDTAITALRDTLEEQIDGKVETWVQSTNPVLDWDEDTLASHDGDLWYYNGLTPLTVGSVTIYSSQTYQYDYENEIWVAYKQPSKSLFDFADGKSTIYYGTTSGTYADVETNDYLVDDTDGSTYKWNGTQWVEVTNYKQLIDDSIADLRQDLEEQIDGKVETWAQSTNPALAWTELESHNGDLWLYTGLTDLVIDGITIHPHGTYKFIYHEGLDILDETGAKITDESDNDLSVEINYTWEQYSSVSNNLFDMTDGKSTIYYGSIGNSYPGVEEGDYLVDSQNGTTYRYTGGQWNAVTKTGGLYATCDSLATAKEKLVVCNESISVYEGLTISVKFTNANTYYSSTAPLTLNVGRLGVKNVYFNGEVISSTNRIYWSEGTTITFMYDGVGWVVVGHPQTYQGTCSTAHDTADKTCEIPDAVIVKGTVVNITFTYTNSASAATLNVIDNTTNAPTIIVDGSSHTLSSTSQYNWNAGATVGFTFDGQYWRMNETSALYNTNSYMKFEATYGLMIANMTGGVVGITSVTTPNAFITSGCTIGGYTYDTGFYVRNGQTVLARFGSSIELGITGANILLGSTSSYNAFLTTSSLLFRYGSSNKQLLYLGYDTTNNVPSIVLGNTDSYNTTIDNTGMSIRSGTTTLATFGTSISLASNGASVTIGSTNSYNTVIGSGGMSINNASASLAEYITTGVNFYANGVLRTSIDNTDGFIIYDTDGETEILTVTTDNFEINFGSAMVSMSPSRGLLTGDDIGNFGRMSGCNLTLQNSSDETSVLTPTELIVESGDLHYQNSNLFVSGEISADKVFANNALIFRGVAGASGVSSSNCDEITKMGIYYITGTPLTNGAGATWAHLMVISNYGDAVVTQYIFRASSINARILAGSPQPQWTPWETIG